MEMQLDGIAFLHDQMRAELGLPTPTPTPPSSGGPSLPGFSSPSTGAEGGPFDDAWTW